MDLKAQKNQLRHSIKERMEKMNAKDRDAESRSVVRRIMENLPANIATVCAYYPMPTEVDIRPLLEELMKKGITVALPRTEGRAFEFRIIKDLAALEPGPFRIPEPTGDDPLLDITTIDLVLLPGIAFDRTGNRLGRGNGGYDQWLERVRKVNNRAQMWGVCFDCQLVNMVPIEPHDKPIDALATPREVHMF